MQYHHEAKHSESNERHPVRSIDRDLPGGSNLSSLETPSSWLPPRSTSPTMHTALLASNEPPIYETHIYTPRFDHVILSSVAPPVEGRGLVRFPADLNLYVRPHTFRRDLNYLGSNQEQPLHLVTRRRFHSPHIILHDRLDVTRSIAALKRDDLRHIRAQTPWQSFTDERVSTSR